MPSANSRSNFVKDGSTAYEYDANGNVTKIGDKMTIRFDYKTVCLLLPF